MTKELKVFEAKGIWTSNFEYLFNVLKTIPTILIESERAAGFFITNIRSSLSDSFVDNSLCFLKMDFVSVLILLKDLKSFKLI